MLAGDAVSVFGVNVLREHGFLSSGAFEDAHFAEVAGGVLRGEKEDVLAVGAFRVTLSFESIRSPVCAANAGRVRTGCDWKGSVSATTKVFALRRFTPRPRLHRSR